MTETLTELQLAEVVNHSVYAPVFTVTFDHIGQENQVTIKVEFVLN